MVSLEFISLSAWLSQQADISKGKMRRDEDVSSRDWPSSVS
jgi:hypothetical protein